MAGEVLSRSYNRVPNAILVFGPTNDDAHALRSLRLSIAALNDHISQIDTAMQRIRQHAEFLEDVSTCIPHVSIFFSIVN